MKALEQDPEFEIGITLLGNCLAKQGEITAAIEHFDRALAIKPDYESAITTKIFALDFVPDADFAVQQAARRCLVGRYRREDSAKNAAASGCLIRTSGLSSAMFPPISGIIRRPSPSCRCCATMTIASFRDYLLLLLPAAGRGDRGMPVTWRCWVDAAQLSDDELADRIQSDGVDILVDLSGHSAGNRLTVFARKPAPIQVTAWGHPHRNGSSDDRLLLRRPGLDSGSGSASVRREESTICRA